MADERTYGNNIGAEPEIARDPALLLARADENYHIVNTLNSFKSGNFPMFSCSTPNMFNKYEYQNRERWDGLSVIIADSQEEIRLLNSLGCLEKAKPFPMAVLLQDREYAEALSMGAVFDVVYDHSQETSVVIEKDPSPFSDALTARVVNIDESIPPRLVDTLAVEWLCDAARLMTKDGDFVRKSGHDTDYLPELDLQSYSRIRTFLEAAAKAMGAKPIGLPSADAVEAVCTSLDRSLCEEFVELPEGSADLHKRSTLITEKMQFDCTVVVGTWLMRLGKTPLTLRVGIDELDGDGEALAKTLTMFYEALGHAIGKENDEEE